MSNNCVSGAYIAYTHCSGSSLAAVVRQYYLQGSEVHRGLIWARAKFLWPECANLARPFIHLNKPDSQAVTTASSPLDSEGSGKACPESEEGRIPCMLSIADDYRKIRDWLFRARLPSQQGWEGAPANRQDCILQPTKRASVERFVGQSAAMQIAAAKCEAVCQRMSLCIHGTAVPVHRLPLRCLWQIETRIHQAQGTSVPA